MICGPDVPSNDAHVSYSQENRKEKEMKNISLSEGRFTAPLSLGNKLHSWLI